MSFTPKLSRVKSPCVNVCMMDTDNGYCLGCKRTLNEIAGWVTYPDAKRLKVLKRVTRREVPPREPDD